MANTVKFETLGTNFPTDREVDFWVSITDRDSGVDIEWTTDERTKPVARWQQTKTPLGNDIPTLAKGTVNIPGDYEGPVTIYAKRHDTGEQKTLPVSFVAWDDLLDDPPVKATQTEIFSTPLLQSVAGRGDTPRPPQDNNTIKLWTRITDAWGDGVKDSPVIWRLNTSQAAVYFFKDEKDELGYYKKAPWAKNFTFVTTLTDEDGVATVRMLSTTSQTAQFFVQAPGMDAPQSQVFFVDLAENIPETSPPVGINAPGGVYKLAPGDRTFTLSMPNITSPILKDSRNIAFLYMQGAGNHILRSFEDISKALFPNKYEFSNAYFNFDTDIGHDDNIVSLHIQTTGATVVRTHPTPFDVTGNFVNAPDPDVTRDDDLSYCLPDPNPGFGNAITQVKNGLILGIAHKLPDKYNGWFLYFNYYLNGYSGNKEIRDFRTRPDPGLEFDQPGQKVEGTKIKYTQALEPGLAEGYGPNSINWNYLPFYCEYYLAPDDGTGKPVTDPDSWIYSPVPPSYLMNT